MSAPVAALVIALLLVTPGLAAQGLVAQGFGRQALAPDLEVAIKAAAEADRQDRQQRGALARAIGDGAGARQLDAGEDAALNAQLGMTLIQAIATRPEQAGAIVEAVLRAAPAAERAMLATIAIHFPGHADMARAVAQRTASAAPGPAAAPAPALPPPAAVTAPVIAPAPAPVAPRLAAAPVPAALIPAGQPVTGSSLAGSSLAGPRAKPAAQPAGDEDMELDDLIPAGPQGAQIDDPWEGFNRAVFAVNDGLDRAILRPVAVGYGTIAPDRVKRWLRNSFDNLKGPVRFANDLLQGEFEAARTTAERFFFNTTIGFLGLFDHATDLGLKRHPADFGQTLNAYGVTSGPYLVLPLLGPTTVRDGIGSGVDTAFSPLTYITGALDGLAVKAGDVVTLRESLVEPIDELRANSIDFYAAIRSIWAQDRARDLKRDTAN
jgi:phospholipid-binding lipoprotein MlaA